MTSHKALTLEEMVESLTDQHNEVDSKLLNILLYTYRSYCESSDIIRLIDKRFIYLNDGEYEAGNSTNGYRGFTKAIIIFLNSWLTAPFSYDFHEFPDFPSLNYLLKCIRQWPVTISFITSLTEFRDSFKRLEEKINKVLISFNAMDSSEGRDYRELPVDCQFRASMALNNNSKDEDSYKNLFDFTPKTIATSLSYLDQKVLQNLRLPELVKHTKKEPAPSVTAIIDNYNKLHNVVKLTVKQPNLARKRYDQFQYSGRNSPAFMDNSIPLGARPVFSSPSLKHEEEHLVIEKWILVAQELHLFRNFSSLVAILTALNSPELKSCVKVLKEKKSIKALKLYQSLLNIIEPYISQNKKEIPNTGTVSGNSSAFNYLSRNRCQLKTLRYNHSEIPYLGIYLRNMTYINEGFPDYVSPQIKVYNGREDRLINIDKCRRQFDVMAQVRLLISSLNCNGVQEDESFSNWYSYIQLEFRKSKRYTSDTYPSSPNLSMESLKSIDSTESSNSNRRTTTPFLPFSKSSQYKSHDCIPRRFQNSTTKTSDVSLARNRSFSANLSAHNNDPKVATVKLKVTKTGPDKGSNHSLNIITTSKPPRKNVTISNGAIGNHNRPPLGNIYRSSSSIDNKDERFSVNLEQVNYKKIEILENDRTTDFVDRVLKKFRKPNLLATNYDVVQMLEDGTEIVITFKSKLFYALAEKSDYQIEVRPRKLTT